MAILEGIKKGETLAEIAKALYLEQSHVRTLYYRSKYPDVVNYKAKKNSKRKKGRRRSRENERQQGIMTTKQIRRMIKSQVTMTALTVMPKSKSAIA